MDMVRIVTIDMSYSTSSWDRNEVKSFNPVTLDIVGWLVEDRQDCLVVASNYQQGEDTFRHLQAIPKQCIREVWKLRKSGKLKFPEWV